MRNAHEALRASIRIQEHALDSGDTAAFRAFWEKMMGRGIFLPPSQFETNFL